MLVKYTIVVGNPWDGMYLVGMFDDFDTAERYADRHYNLQEWWIKEIEDTI